MADSGPTMAGVGGGQGNPAVSCQKTIEILVSVIYVTLEFHVGYYRKWVSI